MDPLSALSLACSVMQVIDFAGKVMSVAKHMKEHGTPDMELRERAEHLQGASEELKGGLATATSFAVDEKVHLRLHEIAESCLQTATALNVALRKIASSRLGVVGTTFNYMIKRTHLGKLERRMEALQHSMQTEILVHLCTREVAVAETQKAAFSDHGRVLQNFILKYCEGQTKLETLIVSQADFTRLHTSRIQDSSESQRRENQQRSQLVGSLRDRDINSRKNQIEETFSETFSWIFDPDIPGRWDSFTKWLCSEENASNPSLYWINGKAGSGKSTLMKFIAENEATERLLSIQGMQCAIYAHYIWASGSSAQRSAEALFRSLLYQMLEKNEDMWVQVSQSQPGILNKRSPEDWSRKELESILPRVLALHQQGPVCIFIDGLDEIDQKHGPFEILEMVQNIRLCQVRYGLKVCVSSRPELAFTRNLEKYPMLRLQDLNQRDIEAFASDFLDLKCSFDLEDDKKSKFLEIILQKAAGVFLWVPLALKSLQKGFSHGDDAELMFRRVDALPSDLSNLYDEMLRRVGDDLDLYSKDAAIYFNVTLLFLDGAEALGFYLQQPLNLFHFALVCDKHLRDRFTVDKCPPHPKDMEPILDRLADKLTTHCAGLLEVVGSPPEETAYPAWEDYRVEFVHRSARDYLSTTRQNLLSQDTTKIEERRDQCLQAIASEDFYYGLITGGLTDTFGGFTLGGRFVMRYASMPMSACSGVLPLVRQIWDILDCGSLFYEVAAQYGLHECVGPLLATLVGDKRAFVNFLLISTLACRPEGVTKFEFEQHGVMTKLLISEGADFRVWGLNCTRWNRLPAEYEFDYFYLPTPLLGFLLSIERFNFDVFKGFDMLLPSSKLNEVLNERFLYLEDWLGFFKRRKHYRTPLRPSEIASCPIDGISLLVEGTCSNLILDQDQFLGKFHGIDAYKQAFKEVGHRRILMLIHHQDDVGIPYGLSKDDSDIINKILGWPQNRVERRGWKREWTSGSGTTTKLNYDGGNVTYSHLGVSSVRGFEETLRDSNIREITQLLKGKEITDIRQYLAEVGHDLPTEEDIQVGMDTRTSLEDMAEMYRKINEKFVHGKSRIVEVVD